MDFKTLRKGMKEIKERKFPYRHDYHYGFHDAVELCSELIEKEIRKQQKAKKKYLKGLAHARKVGQTICT